MKRIAINARFRRGPQTGVQRVASELVQRLDLPMAEFAPAGTATGVRGHVWEQMALPVRLAGAPLFSPCNTGPVLVRAQVALLHDAATFDHPEWFSRGFVASYRALWPLLARRARRIVTVSEFSRGRLAEALGLPRVAIEVVPNGVSAHFAPQSAPAIGQATAAFGLTPGRYFATLSTLEPRKNLGLVLEAWRRLTGRLPADIRLVLIGGSGGGHIFRGEGGGSDDPAGVIRTGFVTDAMLPALLGGAIALVYPTRYEGFGLPPLEAMACGTPAIVTPLASLPEVCGEAALYVDADDGKALADYMADLVRSPSLRAELAEAGLARAAGFTWDNAARHMREILIRDLAL